MKKGSQPLWLQQCFGHRKAGWTFCPRLKSLQLTVHLIWCVNTARLLIPRVLTKYSAEKLPQYLRNSLMRQKGKRGRVGEEEKGRCNKTGPIQGHLTEEAARHHRMR